ncbi:MAG: S24 family peptidase [Balneolaceae bacterium]
MGSVNPSKKNLTSRLKKLESVLGLKPTEMAALGGCSRATYYRYRNGESAPTLKFLNKLLKYENNVSAEWLLEGDGSILKHTDGITENGNEGISTNSEKQDFYNLPLRKMHSDGENKHRLGDNFKGTKSIALSKTLLNFLLKKEDFKGYDGAFIMVVEDDYMMPEVKEGGIILVDNKQVKPQADGIYIVRYDDFVRMKIVQPLPGQKLMLTTLDKKFEPIIVEKDQDGFEILGRVIWSTNPI